LLFLEKNGRIYRRPALFLCFLALACAAAVVVVVGWFPVFFVGIRKAGGF